MAIRAVSGEDVVTATQIARDGRFRIELPAGATYRLEVLTLAGVKQVLEPDASGWKGLEVKVCVPTAPFDLGGMEDSGTGGMCDPSDPNQAGCGDPPPDPDCMANPTDPNCKMDPCTTNPMDPNCQPPPPCGGMNEPACPPDPCEANPMDPNCGKPPPCSDPMDPNCMGCQPGDPNCGGGGTMYCEDPMDPTTCKDPCAIDPMSCGCMAGDPNCWPPPEPPPCMDDPMSPNTMTCDPGNTMTPANVPGDFGCMGILGT